MYPSHQYRDYLRYIRALLGPEHEALLMGQRINNLTMRDLEALVELVTGVNPRHLAPSDYRPRQ